jgi:hypothetical protein
MSQTRGLRPPDNERPFPSHAVPFASHRRTACGIPLRYPASLAALAHDGRTTEPMSKYRDCQGFTIAGAGDGPAAGNADRGSPFCSRAWLAVAQIDCPATTLPSVGPRDRFHRGPARFGSPTSGVNDAGGFLFQVCRRASCQLAIFVGQAASLPVNILVGRDRRASPSAGPAINYLWSVCLSLGTGLRH